VIAGYEPRGLHALFLFIVLVFLGEPLFAIISALALFCFLFLDPTNPSGPLDKITQVILSFATLSEHDTLIAIPLFTLAGTIMTHGGISARLVAVARALVGWLPGGLGMACVAACTLFAAISGSSAVTIIAIGGLVYPALRKEGFSENFSLGLITSCGAIGILIPPSLPLIIYGVVASNAVTGGAQKPAIADLFTAGLIPSLLSVGALCLFSAAVALLRRVPAERFSFRDILATLQKGFFALLLIVILLGGIYGGYTTATEASAVACIYALFIELVVHREIGLRDLLKIGRETVILVGVILMILVSALAFTNYLTIQKVPDQATDIMQWERVTVRHELFSDADFETIDMPVFVESELAGGGIRVRPFDATKAPRDVTAGEIGKRTKTQSVLVGRFHAPDALRDLGGKFAREAAEAKKRGEDLWAEAAKSRPEEARAIEAAAAREEKLAAERAAHAKLVENVLARLGPGEAPFEVKDPTDWDGARYLALPEAAIVAKTEPLVHTKLGFLIVVNLLLLLVGSVMDIYSGIVVIAPLIVPMAIAYGVNLVHLGIIFVLNLELGLAHPPLGINLFIAQSYFRKSILKVTVAAIPFLLLLLGVLAAVTYWEPLSLWMVARARP
jgi:tripartite ATP-independent transporter DctM subunit